MPPTLARRSSRPPSGPSAPRVRPDATACGAALLLLCVRGTSNGYVAVSVHDPREPAVFFFFSNRLGCAGSLLLSLAVTAVLIAIFAL